MANAWIIRPLPMTVTAPLGTTVGDPSYLTNDYMGVVWGNAGANMADGGPGNFFHVLDIDMGVDMAIDTIIALGTRELPFGTYALVQANTAAQGPFGAAMWSSASLSPYSGDSNLPNGDQTFQWSAPLNGTPPAARYWRLVFGAPTRFYLQLRRLIFGRRIDLARNFSNGAAFGVRDLGSFDFSARGVILRRRAAKLRTVGVTFPSIYRDELETRIQPLLEYLGNTETVTLITDPSPHAQLPRRTYHGPLVGDVGSIQRRYDIWQAALNIVSLI